MSLSSRHEGNARDSSEFPIDGEVRRLQDRGTTTKKTRVLPVLLSPSSLRPLAFRTFTKKHNLTVTSASLQSLATFVGKNCGAGWREDGLAEPVLDDIAKTWKKSGGGVIVEEGQKVSLKSLLQNMEDNMSGGKIVHGAFMKRMDPQSLTLDHSNQTTDSGGIGSPQMGGKMTSVSAENREGLLDNGDAGTDDDDVTSDPRKWIRVVGAFEQPRLVYNVQKKHFEQSSVAPSVFPPPSHKAALFRDRYDVLHQRLLHNEAFQNSSSASFGRPSGHHHLKLTSIANLQGRNGTSHLLLGLLSVSPTGDLSLTDPTGTTTLDLRQAKTVPEGGAWFTPGMIVLVDGIYQEEELVSASSLGGSSGIGGTIGGNFLGFSIGGPPCERREVSLGISRPGGEDIAVGQRFGWTDFLGVGSECLWGPRMRRIENRYLQKTQPGEPHNVRNKIVIMSEVNLDILRTREAVKAVLNSYGPLPDENLPLVFLLIGSFVSQAVIGEQGAGGSIEYKENFNNFASILSEYPRLLRNSTFVFVPGDNDLWASSFSAGATTAMPKMPIPEMFTSRIQRAFNVANNDFQSTTDLSGRVVWTTNPTRLSIFGPVQELVVFRDDISGRLRRSSLSLKRNDVRDSHAPTESASAMSDESQSGAPIIDSDVPGTLEIDEKRQQQAEVPHTSASRKLVKTILDQGCLSPFPLSLRPTLWDYMSALQLYPLPTALVLADPETEPFTLTYEGCHVMNPGRLVPETCTDTIKWIEYNLVTAKGYVCEKQQA